MPKLGSRKDPAQRTSPVTFSLPGHIIDALDAEMAATGETSRSKLLTTIITYWLENKPEPAPSPAPDLVEEDVARIRAFFG